MVPLNHAIIRAGVLLFNAFIFTDELTKTWTGFWLCFFQVCGRLILNMLIFLIVTYIKIQRSMLITNIAQCWGTVQVQKLNWLKGQPISHFFCTLWMWYASTAATNSPRTNTSLACLFPFPASIRQRFLSLKFPKFSQVTCHVFYPFSLALTL